MSEKDIEVTVENNMLTIKGERKFEEEVKKENYHRIERAYGTFQRSFQLPSTVDVNKIVAEQKIKKAPRFAGLSYYSFNFQMYINQLYLSSISPFKIPNSSACIFSVISPLEPFPIVILSTLFIGVISAAVPVKNNSSAM